MTIGQNNTSRVGHILVNWELGHPIRVRNWNPAKNWKKHFLRRKREFGEDPPKPTHWGGFALTAHSIEFWQGGPSRLHDRLIYEKEAGAWSIRRLNP